MPTPGTIFVSLLLVAVVILAARSVWKTHKSGGCSGSCASCGKRCER